MLSAFESLRYAYKDESIISSGAADLENVNDDNISAKGGDKLHNIDEDLSYHSCHPMDADKYEVRKFDVDTSFVSGADSHGNSDHNTYNTGMPGIIDVSSILDDETDANKITIAGQQSVQFSRFSRGLSNVGQNRSNSVIHCPTMDVHVDHLAEVLVHDNEDLSEGTGSYTDGSSINLNQNIWNEDYDGNPDPSVLNRLTQAKHLPKGLDAVAIHRIKRAKILRQLKKLEDDLSSTGSCEFMFDNVCMPRMCGKESEDDDDSINSILDVQEGASLEASVDLESLKHRKPKVSRYALVPDGQYMSKTSSGSKKPEELVLMLPKRSTSSQDGSQSGFHQLNSTTVTDDSNLLHSDFLPLQFARNDSNLTDERKTYVEEEMEFTLQKYDLADPQRVAKIIMSGVDPEYKEYDKDEVEANDTALYDCTIETEIEEVVQLDGCVFKVRRIPDDDDPVEGDRSVRSSSDESSLHTNSAEEGETKKPELEETMEDDAESATDKENQIEPSHRRFFKILSNLHPDYKMQVVPLEEENDEYNDANQTVDRGPHNACTSPVQCLMGCGGNTDTLMDEPEELFKSFEMPATVMASLSALSQERGNGQYDIEKSSSEESPSPRLVPAISGSEDDEEASDEEHPSDVVMATLTNMTEEEAVANLHEVYSREEGYPEDDDYEFTLEKKESTEKQAVMASLDEMIEELNEISDVDESTEIGSMSANLDDLIDDLSAASLHLFPEEEELELLHTPTAETEPESISPTEMAEEEATTTSNLSDTLTTPSSQYEGIEAGIETGIETSTTQLTDETTQLTVETEPVSASTTELTEDEAINVASSDVDTVVTLLAGQGQRAETAPINTHVTDNSVNIAVSNLSFASVALPSLESGASSSSQDQGINTAPAITVSESQEDSQALCGVLSLAALISGPSAGNKDKPVQVVSPSHNKVTVSNVSSSNLDKAATIPTSTQDAVETVAVNTNINEKAVNIDVSNPLPTSAALPHLESQASSSSQDQGIKTAPAMTISESHEDSQALCGAISLANLISSTSSANTNATEQSSKIANVVTSHNDAATATVSISSSNLDKSVTIPTPSQDERVENVPVDKAVTIPTPSQDEHVETIPVNKAVTIPTPSQDEHVETMPVSTVDIAVSNPSFASVALPSIETGASSSSQDQGIMTAPAVTVSESQDDFRGFCGAITLATSNANLSFLREGTTSCIQDTEAVKLAVKGCMTVKGMDAELPQTLLNAKRLSAPDTPIEILGFATSVSVREVDTQAVESDLSQGEVQNEDVDHTPSHGEKDVTDFDCERDSEIEFVEPMSPQSDDESYDDRIIKQSSSSFTEYFSLNPVSCSHNVENDDNGAENVAPSMSFNIRSPDISDEREKQKSLVKENKKVFDAEKHNSTTTELDLSEDGSKSIMPNISQMDIPGFSGCFNRASSGTDASMEDDMNMLMDALDLTLNATTTASFSSSQNEEVVVASVVKGIFAPNDSKVGRIILPSEYKELCEGIEVESSVGSFDSAGRNVNCTSDDSDVFFDANEELGTSPRRVAMAESPKLTIMDDLTFLRKKMLERMSKNSIRRSSRSPMSMSLLDVATTAEAKIREVAEAKKLLQS